MKARVKETGETIDIIRNSAFDKDVFYDSNGRKYNREELSFDFKEKSFPKDDPDYWTRLEHQYAGMAMQGILSSQDYCRLLIEEDIKGSFAEDVSRCASVFAHALVEKMKEVK